MENALTVISSICGILGFIISLYAVNEVVKIKKQINITDNSDKSIRQNAFGSKNTQTANEK